MQLYINEELVTQGEIPAVRECVAHNASVLAWFNSSVKLWNTFYKRVELRDANGNLWGLEL
jgi:hypothetical protein